VFDLTSMNAEKLGIVGILFVALLGGMRKWWVWGWAYDQVVAERDEWKHLALKSFELASKVTEAAEKVATTSETRL